MRRLFPMISAKPSCSCWEKSPSRANTMNMLRSVFMVSRTSAFSGRVRAAWLSTLVVRLLMRMVPVVSSQ